MFIVNLNAVENLTDEKSINHKSVMGPKTLIILLQITNTGLSNISTSNRKDILYKLTSLHYGHWVA